MTYVLERWTDRPRLCGRGAASPFRTGAAARGAGHDPWRDGVRAEPERERHPHHQAAGLPLRAGLQYHEEYRSEGGRR